MKFYYKILNIKLSTPCELFISYFLSLSLTDYCSPHKRIDTKVFFEIMRKLKTGTTDDKIRIKNLWHFREKVKYNFITQLTHSLFSLFKNFEPTLSFTYFIIYAIHNFMKIFPPLIFHRVETKKHEWRRFSSCKKWVDESWTWTERRREREKFGCCCRWWWTCCEYFSGGKFILLNNGVYGIYTRKREYGFGGRDDVQS